MASTSEEEDTEELKGATQTPRWRDLDESVRAEGAWTFTRTQITKKKLFVALDEVTDYDDDTGLPLNVKGGTRPKAIPPVPPNGVARPAAWMIDSQIRWTACVSPWTRSISAPGAF